MASIIDPNNCSVLHLRGKLKEPAVVSSFEEGLGLEVRGSGPRFCLPIHMISYVRANRTARRGRGVQYSHHI